MYIDIEKLRNKVPGAMSAQEYVKKLSKDEPTVILRNYDEPTSPPYKQNGVKTLDIANEKHSKDVREPYGGRPSIPGETVFDAIVTALGPGGYQVFMSDSSYTHYDIYELYEYLVNFDSTNLETWIAEVHDCDDFAEAVNGSANRFLKGIPLGVLWYGDKAGTWGHAVNIFYCGYNQQVFLLEPQADQFYHFDQENWNPWVVMM